MTNQQIRKIIDVGLIACFLMFVFELLFSFDSITNGINSWIQGDYVLIIIWVLMFVQVCIVPIPAYIVLNACVVLPSIQLSVTTARGWLIIGIILSAYIVGAVVAYLIGRKWGSKAVKWCAGDDENYKKWSDILNNKGKWWYAATIILPIFPDDLLCLVCGAVKFNFRFFFWSNLIGRGIGLVTMTIALTLLHYTSAGGFPWSVVIWGAVVLALLICDIIFRIKEKRNV